MSQAHIRTFQLHKLDTGCMSMIQRRQKQTNQPKRDRIYKRFLQALDLPVDADGTVLKITMVADTDLLIENHKGVIRYTENFIRFHSDHGIIRVEGQQLQLSEFAAERAYVRGVVHGWFLESKCDRDVQ